MAPIDIPAIEEQARKLRAAEIQRMNGLFAERARLVASLAAESLGVAAKAMSDALRPLFSWNPHPSTKPLSLSAAPAVERVNHAMRALFSWNPQSR